MEEWHIPGKTVSESATNRKHRRMTEHLTSDSLGDTSWVQKAALQLCRRNVSLLHPSRYVTVRDQFYQAFPALVPQAKNAGVRRPVYEVKHAWDSSVCIEAP